MAIFTAAAIQMRSGTEPERNAEDFEVLVREAARAGAAYVQTPEMTGAVVRDSQARSLAFKPEETDGIAAAARRLGLTVRSLHQYVVGVYQKLGVRSRGELAAHFLSAAKRDAALAHQAGRFVERERQVLDGLVRGLSEKEIADVARWLRGVLGP